MASQFNVISFRYNYLLKKIISVLFPFESRVLSMVFLLSILLFTYSIQFPHHCFLKALRYFIVYVDASDECNQLSFLSDTAATNRQWNIRITQIACNSILRPPEGCTQYFYGESSGHIKVRKKIRKFNI